MTFVFSICLTGILLSIVVFASALLKPYEETASNTTTKISTNPCEEYKEGSKFSQSYIKASWTATSIFLPVCFGLVAVSYQEHLLDLSFISLLPLAIASVSLFLVWWLYTNRYAQYNRSIWSRLQELEIQTGMCLHLKIDKEDKSRAVRWRIRHVNLLMLVLLLIAWIVRIIVLPLI